MYFIQVKKSAQGEQEWTTTFPSNFVIYWYAYLQTSKIFTAYFDACKIPLTFLKMFFRNWFNGDTKESFFMFNNNFNKQFDGVAMGSPLGPALANMFIHSFENKWLKDCLHGLSPSSIDGIDFYRHQYFS